MERSAVFAPIPSAKVRMAIAEKPGDLGVSEWRTANLATGSAWLHFMSSLMLIIIGNQRGNRRPSTRFEADVLRRLHAEGGGSVRPLTGGKS
jgi:hypothetical protein